MREIRASLAGFQETQTRMQQSLANLVRINAGTGNDGMDVFVKNLNMPFFAMVGFMIKWSIASIPAAIILVVLGLSVLFGVSLLCGGLTGIIAFLSNLGR